MTSQKRSEQRTACPGPIPKSAEHAARCRACGKCGALAKLLSAGKIEGGGFSQVAALANG
jgi:hypothetical protein